MKILQKPISPKHKSAMFFDGLIAEFRGFELKTYQDGELVLYNNKEYSGKEILGLVKIINDDDIDDELIVDIQVDKFFCIYFEDTLLDDDNLYFDNYDDALQGFQEFLKKNNIN